MKGRYTVQDAYRARITADVSPISASGDPLTEFEIKISTLPIDTEWRLILDYNDATKRDKVYFHRVSGSSIYYYRKNRSNPTVLHEENAYIQMNNFAERFNYGFDNTDDFGLILDMWTNKAQILWGLVDIGDGVVDVDSTAITTLVDGTHYAVLDYADTTLKFVSAYDITTHLLVGQVVVLASDITSRVDKRHTKIFSNRSTLLKLSEFGWNLLYNWVPLGWWSWTGDVIWPSSSINGNLVVFNGATWKIVANGWPVPEILDNAYWTSWSTDNTGWASRRSIYDKIEEIDSVWRGMDFILESMPSAHLTTPTVTYTHNLWKKPKFIGIETMAGNWNWSTWDIHTSWYHDVEAATTKSLIIWSSTSWQIITTPDINWHRVSGNITEVTAEHIKIEYSVSNPLYWSVLKLTLYS